MTTDERRELIAALTTAANILPDDPYVTDNTYVKTLTRGECREILAMFDEAKFVAEGLITGDTNTITSHEKQTAHNLVAALSGENAESPPQHNLTDDALIHSEANDYDLSPDAVSVWIGVGSVVVYIRRTGNEVIVELLPNHDEYEGTVYDSCSASLEGDEDAL